MRMIRLVTAWGKTIRLKLDNFCAEHKIFVRIWVIYVFVLIISYAMLPIAWENTWFHYFEYLFQNNAFPYIDYREGYPPLGFFAYMPLAYLAGNNLLLFTYGMRAINATFLLLSVPLAYLITHKVRGKRDAIFSSLLFMALPSVILMNRGSNDIIALFFSLLALYLMLVKKSNLAGMTIGLAAMVKGFPALLLLPALRWFKETRRRCQIAGATFITVYFMSLPFLIADPFMYMSTFIHHGTRGPWETIWALVDGWYSHGGFLHPDFDQFFYHYQLLKIYPLLPNDHAFYAWRYPSLSTLLFIGELAAILGSYLLIGKCDHEKALVKGVSLTFFGYMLFFKGYSPQFTVFLLPLMLVSIDGLWKICLSVPLEVATDLQMLAWIPETWFSYDYHTPILVSAVVIRTVALMAAVSLLSAQLWKLRKGEAKLS